VLEKLLLRKPTSKKDKAEEGSKSNAENTKKLEKPKGPFIHYVMNASGSTLSFPSEYPIPAAICQPPIQ
jgi:hypothetical protein